MTKTLATRLDALEARRRPVLAIVAVVIGGAPVAGVVIVIGERNPSHDANQPG